MYFSTCFALQNFDYPTVTLYCSAALVHTPHPPFEPSCYLYSPTTPSIGYGRSSWEPKASTTDRYKPNRTLQQLVRFLPLHSCNFVRVIVFHSTAQRARYPNEVHKLSTSSCEENQSSPPTFSSKHQADHLSFNRQPRRDSSSCRSNGCGVWYSLHDALHRS